IANPMQLAVPQRRASRTRTVDATPTLVSVPCCRGHSYGARTQYAAFSRSHGMGWWQRRHMATPRTGCTIHSFGSLGHASLPDDLVWGLGRRQSPERFMGVPSVRQHLDLSDRQWQSALSEIRPYGSLGHRERADARFWRLRFTRTLQRSLGLPPQQRYV